MSAYDPKRTFRGSSLPRSAHRPRRVAFYRGVSCSAVRQRRIDLVPCWRGRLRRYHAHMSEPSLIERAFALARKGSVCTVTELKRVLAQQGVRERDFLFYLGSQRIQRELREAMRAAGCPRRGSRSSASPKG